MSEDAHKPVRFAVAHVFTTGRDPSRDSILHVACRIYSEDMSPQINDWIVNPGETIRKGMWRRLWIRTGIGTKEANEEPLWGEIRDKVLSFLESVDMIFVRNSDVKTKWFEGVVYKDMSPPVLIDLMELYQFFLPAEPVPYSDSDLIKMGESTRVSERNRKLHKVLAGMTGVLDSILRVVLKREKNNTEDYQLVYSLLHWALSVEGNSPDFRALFKIATAAARIQWATVAQIEGIYYDSPVRLKEDHLRQFILNWMPSKLIEKDREPFDESLSVSEILDRDAKDSSTSKLLKSLRFVLSFADDKREETERLASGVNTVERLLRELQVHVSKVARQFQAASNAGDPKDETKPTANCEDFSSALIKLDTCMGEIEKELCDVLTCRLFSGWAADIFPRVRGQVEESLERTRMLRRSLSDALQPFLISGQCLTDPTFRKAAVQVLQQFPKIGHEYFTRTNPIRDESLPLAYELAEDFRLSVTGAELDRREEQRKYSRFIQGAVNTGGSYAIEAGTGTGKTLGYLIPGCEHLRINKERQVVVATATINLMDQIVIKEWTTLASRRGSRYHDLDIAILKGKRNYLCVSALKRLFTTLNLLEKKGDKSKEDGELIHSDDRIAWLYLFQILTHKNGQWDNVSDFTEKYPRISEKFEADLDAESVCKPRLCRMDKNCSYPQAVRRAQFAHVLITNHHKLTNLEDKIQKRASVCIIDEADQFPDNLRSALSESFSKKEVMDFARRVAGTKNRRGFVQILRDGLKETRSRGMKGVSQDFERPFEILGKIEESCHQVNECLWNSIKELKNISEIRWNDLLPDHQNALNDILKCLDRQLSIIAVELKQILQYDPEIFRMQKSEFFDRVNRYAYDAEEFWAIVKSVIPAITGDEFVVTYRQKFFDWTITKMPFGIGNNVKNTMRRFETVVLTSGTLYVDKALDLLLLELLDDEASCSPFVADLTIPSPFHYDRQVHGAATGFIEQYDHRSSNEKWKQGVLETIALQSVALDGRTLVLFRSWEEMQDIYERVHPVLQEFGIPLLLQDRVGSSEAIIREFSGLEESVLFGTKRFWAGVDFPGSTLSQLMIVRLPNKHVKSPLAQERRERWRRDTFWDLWYAQNTRRKLHQGFGRLVRKKDDRGLFIILDSRILTDSRMTAHKRAIPIELKTDFGHAIELANWSVQIPIIDKRKRLIREIEERGIDLEQAYQKIKRMLQG